MSDEPRKDDHGHDNEVEAHRRRPAFDEPTTTETEDDNEVEAHRKRARHRPRHRA
jgi:hypothetical protein